MKKISTFSQLNLLYDTLSLLKECNSASWMLQLVFFVLPVLFFSQNTNSKPNSTILNENASIHIVGEVKIFSVSSYNVDDQVASEDIETVKLKEVDSKSNEKKIWSNNLSFKKKKTKNIIAESSKIKSDKSKKLLTKKNYQKFSLPNRGEHFSQHLFSKICAINHTSHDRIILSNSHLFILKRTEVQHRKVYTYRTSEVLYQYLLTFSVRPPPFFSI